MNSKKKQDIESTIFQHNWTIFVDIDIRTIIVHIFDHELEQWNMITNRQYFYAYNIYYTLHCFDKQFVYTNWRIAYTLRNFDLLFQKYVSSFDS